MNSTMPQIDDISRIYCLAYGYQKHLAAKIHPAPACNSKWTLYVRNIHHRKTLVFKGTLYLDTP